MAERVEKWMLDAFKEIRHNIHSRRLANISDLDGAYMIAAHAPAGDTPQPDGWVLADETGKEFRIWDGGIPDWTTDPLKALRMCRREDAEAIAAEDEDVWGIHRLSSLAPLQSEAHADHVRELVAAARMIEPMLGRYVDAHTDKCNSSDCATHNTYTRFVNALAHFPERKEESNG